MMPFQRITLRPKCPIFCPFNGLRSFPFSHTSTAIFFFCFCFIIGTLNHPHQPIPLSFYIFFKVTFILCLIKIVIRNGSRKVKLKAILFATWWKLQNLNLFEYVSRIFIGRRTTQGYYHNNYIGNLVPHHNNIFILLLRLMLHCLR